MAATYKINQSKTKGQYTVFKNGRAITTGNKRHACQSFIHFNSIIGTRAATEAETEYFDGLSDADLDEAYPVGTAIIL